MDEKNLKKKNSLSVKKPVSQKEKIKSRLSKKSTTTNTTTTTAFVDNLENPEINKEIDNLLKQNNNNVMETLLYFININDPKRFSILLKRNYAVGDLIKNTFKANTLFMEMCENDMLYSDIDDNTNHHLEWISVFNDFMNSGHAHVEFINQQGTSAIGIVNKYQRKKNNFTKLVKTFMENNKSNNLSPYYKGQDKPFEEYVEQYTKYGMPMIVNGAEYIDIEFYKFLYPTPQWNIEIKDYIEDLPEYKQNIIYFYQYKGDNVMNQFIRNNLDINLARKQIYTDGNFMTSYFEEKGIEIERINHQNIEKYSDEEILNIIKEMIAELDDIIKNAPPLDKNIVVFRGQQTLHHHEQYKIYETMGFLSTSMHVDIAKRFAGDNGFVYHIIIPKGVCGLSLSLINYLSRFISEKEILFPSKMCFYIGTYMKHKNANANANANTNTGEIFTHYSMVMKNSGAC